jgi:AcrR family transcriptional regulator
VPTKPQTATEAGAPDRRTRLRAWTREEIKAAALRQLEQHGVEGISLNAIAKELGMTGPALYRYVGSRDELLADLVVDAWQDLSDALADAAEKRPKASAAKRLGAIGLAYRAWALGQPHRYRLAVQTELGSGALAPDRVIPAAQRGMAAILDATGALSAARKPRQQPPAELRKELNAWTRRVGGQRLPPPVLMRGIIFWSRLHGLMSLELDGHLASMQLDPELLYRSELAELGGET